MALYASLTTTWHQDTYAAIDPAQRSELSLKDKTVVISGGGTAIGRALSLAFADAGASPIAILGRREGELHTTKGDIESRHERVAVSIHLTDLVDLDAVEAKAAEIGRWDILVCNAGYLSDLPHLVNSEPEEWWNAFQVNVSGASNLARAFMPARNPGAVFLGLSAGSTQVDEMSSNSSTYDACKFAAVRMLENVASENPELHVVSMLPRIVPNLDTVELPAHFAVWLCSSEASFLRGSFVWCNWDVEELLEKKAEIERTHLLTADYIAWPYSSARIPSLL